MLPSTDPGDSSQKIVTKCCCGENRDKMLDLSVKLLPPHYLCLLTPLQTRIRGLKVLKTSGTS